MGMGQERAEAEFCLRRKSDTCIVGFDPPKSLSVYRLCRRIKLFLNIRLFWRNTGFCLPACDRWEGPCDQRDRDPHSCPAKDSKLCFIAFESQWETSYSFRISNPPRNKYLVYAWLFNSLLGFSKVRKKLCSIIWVLTSKVVSRWIYMQPLKIRWVRLNLPEVWICILFIS